MRVKWTDHAFAQRNQIASYIHRQFGIKRKIRFLQKVRQMTQMLKKSPNIGSIDPLFASRPLAYRSIIINGLSKMVYRVDDDVIHIVGFWDCRQEPQNQAAQTETSSHDSDFIL